MNQIEREISAVIFRDGEKWIAHGLEFDICAQGDSIEEVTDAFELAFVANICVSMHLHNKPLEGIEAAPEKYWNMFRDARLSVESPKEPRRLPTGVPGSALRPQFRLLESQVAA